MEPIGWLILIGAGAFLLLGTNTNPTAVGTPPGVAPPGSISTDAQNLRATRGNTSAQDTVATGVAIGTAAAGVAKLVAGINWGNGPGGATPQNTGNDPAGTQGTNNAIPPVQIGAPQASLDPPGNTLPIDYGSFMTTGVTDDSSELS